MSLSVEIIDFTRPVANSKNLYISGIVSDELSEADIMSALYEAGSSFGLVYEVQVFPGVKCSATSFRRSATTNADATASFYAFLKFYSYHVAQKAKAYLSKNLKLGSQSCKVAFASRNKETEAGQMLYVSKCQELANHYLAFNGWTSAIKRLDQDKEAGKENSASITHIRFFCHVELSFPRQGLRTQGIGAWEEAFCPQDPSSKSTAILKARKRSHQRAMEHAFSRVLLVILSNGKVTVEIDTTTSDDLTQRQMEALAEEQVLKVNELNVEPPDETDNAISMEMKATDDSVGLQRDTTQNLDDVNMQILQELGDG